MPREDATRNSIGAFLRELGRQFKGIGSLYLAGGAALVYEGFRPRTLDIDYRVDLMTGDDTEFIRALRGAQRLVPLNVEPASPADFIPLPAGWRDRCRFLLKEGGLSIYAFDPLSTALAKIERAVTSTAPLVGKHDMVCGVRLQSALENRLHDSTVLGLALPLPLFAAT